MKTDCLAINTLAANQQDVSNVFGGKKSQSERFEIGEWETTTTGSPILKHAAINFECKIIERKSVATHDVIFVEVLTVQEQQDAGALLYYKRAYNTLA